MQFFDLLLVRWIFGRQIGHKNYEDFEHPILESNFPLLAVEQFARIINDSGYISLRRLTDEEITGTERTTGLVGKYLSLSTENVQCLEDMELSARGMRIGNKHLCLHTLSQTEDLPTEVSVDNRFERLSTDRSYWTRLTHKACCLSVPISMSLHGARIWKSWSIFAMMWAVSWQAWNVCHATIRWIVRNFSGLRYPATRMIFRQRRVSIPSSSSQCVSSRRKPPIWILPYRSESRWQTASVESCCT